MSRVALLIGVSLYPSGLAPLPKARKDVEVLRRVLNLPHLGFTSVQCLSDRPQQEMSEAIETFFRNRAETDQTILLFSGYTMVDHDGLLYFAPPTITADEHGSLMQSRTIPASFVQTVMNHSPATQQVLILDGCWRLATGSPPSDAQVKVDFATQLGGAGRVILAASTMTQGVAEPENLDGWSYARYLAEGIETGAADRDHDGILTLQDIHHYAQRKVKLAAPAIEPQISGSDHDTQRPWLEIPRHEPTAAYRKLLESTVDQVGATGAVDASGSSLLCERRLLDDTRQELGLSLQDASEIEAQVLRPVREYRQRLQCYQEMAAYLTPGHRQNVAVTQNRDGSPSQERHDRQLLLKLLQQSLGLTDPAIAAITATTQLTAQHQQRDASQKNLMHYEQVFLAAVQRQYPLTESDRRGLRELQKVLCLSDASVKASETQILSEVAQMTTRLEDSTPKATHAKPEPMPGSDRPPIVNTVIQPDPLPMRPLPEAPRAGEDFPNGSLVSPNKEEVIHRLVEQMEAEDAATMHSPPPHLLGTQPPATMHPLELPPPPRAGIPGRGQPITPEQPSATQKTGKSRAQMLRALIVPGVMLAILGGTLAALYTSTDVLNFLKPRDGSQANNGSQASAQQRSDALNSQGLNKSKQGFNKAAIDDFTKAIQSNPDAFDAYINRGFSQHRLGNKDAAIKDYSEAIERLKKSNPTGGPNPQLAKALSNRSHVYHDQKNYDKALEDANAAVANDPSLAEAFVNLANARLAKNDLPNAISDYGRAIALNPPKPILAGAYNNRGNVFFAQKQLPEALANYTRAIQLNPTYADAYYNRGIVMQAMGNRTEATVSFQQAANFYQQEGRTDLAQDAKTKAGS